MCLCVCVCWLGGGGSDRYECAVFRFCSDVEMMGAHWNLAE